MNCPIFSEYQSQLVWENRAHDFYVDLRSRFGHMTVYVVGAWFDVEARRLGVPWRVNEKEEQ